MSTRRREGRPPASDVARLACWITPSPACRSASSRRPSSPPRLRHGRGPDDLGLPRGDYSYGLASPEGVAACSTGHTVRLWEIDNGACQVLGSHSDEVFAVAFHPDGTRLATAGRDRAVWLWDLARGEEVARLLGHTSYVWSLAFSPDGATLASGSGDFTVRLWDTAPLKTRYQALREAEALRPEAERMVEELFREKKDAAEVVEALRADRALSDSQRQAALRAVLRRVQPPEAAPGNPHDPPARSRP